MRGEREKLLHMEDVLSKRVVGQDEAITASGLSSYTFIHVILTFSVSTL